MSYEQYFKPVSTMEGTTTVSGSGPEDSFLGPYFTRLLFGKYVRPKAFQPTEWSPDLELRLPLPTKLQDTTSIQYNTPSFTGAGALAAGMSGEAEAAALRPEVAAAAAGAVGSGISAVLGSFKGSRAEALGGFLKNFGSAVAGTASAAGYTPENAALIAQQQLGVVPNPNYAAQFTGPQLRAYSYTWALYPRSKSESDNIKELIRQIKIRTLPKVEGDATALLQWPNLVQVNFFPWDTGGSATDNYFTDNSIVRYKRSFVTSMSADYNPYGTPGFFQESNMPTTIQLTLNFLEAEYVTAEDWMSGGAEKNWGIAPAQPGAATPEEIKKYEQDKNVAITKKDGISVLTNNGPK